MDSAKEVMAWDRIGFVVIEGFFCFLVVKGWITFDGWIKMVILRHPKSLVHLLLWQKTKLRFILYHGNDDPC